jgi:hypothetical protein
MFGATRWSAVVYREVWYCNVTSGTGNLPKVNFPSTLTKRCLKIKYQ